MTTAAVAPPRVDAATAAAPIVVSHLAKHYGAVTAVEDVSFTVEASQVVGLLGPNGAGKTTTVKALVGLIRPSAGTVRVFGHSPLEPAIRARLGYLPELFRFPEWLTGYQVLHVHARLAGVPPRKRNDLIAESLELVGLGDRGNERVRGYSKGMSQRLGLAQALLARPPLVLLDEPTSALDPLGRRLVRDIIRQLKASGTTVLLNSHLLPEVESVCDTVVVMDRGRLRWSGPLEQLRQRGVRLRVRLDRPDAGAQAILERFGEVSAGRDGTLHVRAANAGVAAEVTTAVVAGGYGLLELTPERRSLEDFYVELVSEGEQ